MVHHHHHHHHHHHQPSEEQVIDKMLNEAPPPRIVNGAYIHTAGTMSICSQLGALPTQAQAMERSGAPLTQLDLTIVGTKVETGNKCCEICTWVWASIVLFPFFFICCNWWKKTVRAAYEVNTQTYQAVANTLRAIPTINCLVLRVVDNAFNAEKAQMVYNMVGGRRLLAFTLENKASEYDWREDEYSRFKANMQPVLSLGVPCEIFWRDQIVGV